MFECVFLRKFTLRVKTCLSKTTLSPRESSLQGRTNQDPQTFTSINTTQTPRTYWSSRLQTPRGQERRDIKWQLFEIKLSSTDLYLEDPEPHAIFFMNMGEHFGTLPAGRKKHHGSPRWLRGLASSTLKPVQTGHHQCCLPTPRGMTRRQTPEPRRGPKINQSKWKGRSYPTQCNTMGTGPKSDWRYCHGYTSSLGKGVSIHWGDPPVSCKVTCLVAPSVAKR